MEYSAWLISINLAVLHDIRPTPSGCELHFRHSSYHDMRLWSRVQLVFMGRVPTWRQPTSVLQHSRQRGFNAPRYTSCRDYLWLSLQLLSVAPMIRQSMSVYLIAQGLKWNWQLLSSTVLLDFFKFLIENSGMQHLLIIAERCFDISK